MINYSRSGKYWEARCNNMEGRTRTDIQPFPSLRRLIHFSPLEAFSSLSGLLSLNLISVRRSTTMLPRIEYLSECRHIIFPFSLFFAAYLGFCQLLDFIASNGRATNKWWIGNDLEGSWRGLEELRRTETSLRIVGVSAEIRTKHIPHVSPEYHRYAKPFGEHHYDWVTLPTANVTGWSFEHFSC
jgi:hypothetical protein